MQTLSWKTKTLIIVIGLPFLYATQHLEMVTINNEIKNIGITDPSNEIKDTEIIDPSNEPQDIRAANPSNEPQDIRAENSINEIRPCAEHILKSEMTKTKSRYNIGKNNRNSYYPQKKNYSIKLIMTIGIIILCIIIVGVTLVVYVKNRGGEYADLEDLGFDPTETLSRLKVYTLSPPIYSTSQMPINDNQIDTPIKKYIEMLHNTPPDSPLTILEAVTDIPNTLSTISEIATELPNPILTIPIVTEIVTEITTTPETATKTILDITTAAKPEIISSTITESSTILTTPSLTTTSTTIPATTTSTTPATTTTTSATTTSTTTPATTTSTTPKTTTSTTTKKPTTTTQPTTTSTTTQPTTTTPATTTKKPILTTPKTTKKPNPPIVVKKKPNPPVVVKKKPSAPVVVKKKPSTPSTTTIKPTTTIKLTTTIKPTTTAKPTTTTTKPTTTAKPTTTTIKPTTTAKPTTTTVRPTTTTTTTTKRPHIKPNAIIERHPQPASRREMYEQRNYAEPPRRTTIHTQLNASSNNSNMSRVKVRNIIPVDPKGQIKTYRYLDQDDILIEDLKNRLLYEVSELGISIEIIRDLYEYSSDLNINIQNMIRFRLRLIVEDYTRDELKSALDKTINSIVNLESFIYTNGLPLIKAMYSSNFTVQGPDTRRNSNQIYSVSHRIYYSLSIGGMPKYQIDGYIEMLNAIIKGISNIKLFYVPSIFVSSVKSKEVTFSNILEQIMVY
ncbi:hypothetical protein NEFER01_1453 [Nematocida sp. LUAm1]|nr:hypothetical protein NEFER02_1659 [Nematocida sp. LUAm2]KAI5178286.1 hypothetical protein NEFER01_1453 [Nematocida sp. LUAm1]